MFLKVNTESTFEPARQIQLAREPKGSLHLLGFTFSKNAFFQFQFNSSIGSINKGNLGNGKGHNPRGNPTVSGRSPTRNTNRGDDFSGDAKRRSVKKSVATGRPVGVSLIFS